jgi:Ca2+-binding RTX toxin-like protein
LINASGIDMSGVPALPEGMQLTTHSVTAFGYSNGVAYSLFLGTFFYGPDGALDRGTITDMSMGSYGQPAAINVHGLSIDVASVLPLMLAGNVYPLFPQALSGNDTLTAFRDSIVLWGGAGNDTLIAESFAIQMFGGDGNDVFQVLRGGNYLYGGDGLDTLKIAYPDDGLERFTWVDLDAGRAFMTTRYSADIELQDIERISYSDGTGIALDIHGNAGQAYRLYQAAFDRAPDLGGMGYQMNALDTGLTLAQVATNFIASPEFQSKYGNVDDAQFIALLYRNVLDRDPDAGGLQYHLNELASNQTRADVLVHFSESPENQANVIGAIADGIQYFTAG